MNNFLLVLGPICLFNAEDQIEGQCSDLIREGWIPTLIIKRGEFFDIMKSRIHLNMRPKLKGIIIATGYNKIFEA